MAAESLKQFEALPQNGSPAYATAFSSHMLRLNSNGSCSKPAAAKDCADFRLDQHVLKPQRMHIYDIESYRICNFDPLNY